MIRPDEIAKRLSGYWRMEGANIVLVPLMIVYLSGGRLGWLSALAIGPMAAMLVVGTIYWRAKWLQVTARRPIRPALRRIAQAEPAMIGATFLALAAAAAGWVRPTFTAGRAERWALTFAAAITALEYVNYYHRQLQHFDRMADWRRLWSGRGFRKSQLRHDLERAGLRDALNGNAR